MHSAMCQEWEEEEGEEGVGALDLSLGGATLLVDVSRVRKDFGDIGEKSLAGICLEIHPVFCC